ncbi:MAG: tetratricopeptide repeat protein [Burkholderiaceae bacterium]
MKIAAVLGLSMLLVGCASAPPMPPAADLFHDDRFAPASTPIDPGAALAISDDMRRYVATRILAGSRFVDRREQLIDALYRKDRLQLEYDTTLTRTAAQAFEARSGNCLALVMMTGALAKEMKLAVRYQTVLGDDAWDRSGDLYVAIGHVNLTLDVRTPQPGFGIPETQPMTVDFVPPPRDARTPRTREISERTLIAMYLNNRAVESLAAERVDDAYWWAREAIRTDPELSSAYITLAVVYRERGLSEFAEPALRRVLEREPDNTKALGNRILVLQDLGRGAEADALAPRLARLEPHPPFSYFDRGMAALRERHFEAARSLLAKEVDRAPHHHEFQFWLAVAYLELGDTEHATRHLERAMKISTTPTQRNLYAGKLDRLKALAPQ